MRFLRRAIFTVLIICKVLLPAAGQRIETRHMRPPEQDRPCRRGMRCYRDLLKDGEITEDHDPPVGKYDSETIYVDGGEYKSPVDDYETRSVRRERLPVDDYETRSIRREGHRPAVDDYETRPVRRDRYKLPADDYETRPVRRNGYRQPDDDYETRPGRRGGYRPPSDDYDMRPVRRGGYRPPSDDYDMRPVRRGGYRPPMDDYEKIPVRGSTHKPGIHTNKKEVNNPPVDDDEAKKDETDTGKPDDDDKATDKADGSDEDATADEVADGDKTDIGRADDEHKSVQNGRTFENGGRHNSRPLGRGEEEHNRRSYSSDREYYHTARDRPKEEDHGHDGRRQDEHHGSEGKQKNCICVLYNMCRNGHIITDGTGFIDARTSQLEDMPLDTTVKSDDCGAFHVCCLPPETSSTKLDEHRCGVRNANGVDSRDRSPRKEGESNFGEWPWQAAVIRKEGKVNIFMCGGVLIDKYHVLTVAQCVYGRSKQSNGEYPLMVRLGEWDTQSTSEYLAHVDYRVAEIVVHAEFRNGSLHNDVALLRLREQVLFGPHVGTVCLPKHDDVFTGHNCVVTGWGRDAHSEYKKEAGPLSNVMKEVSMAVIDHEKCEEMLRKTRLGSFFQLHEGFLCAGGNPGEDSCKGDGGGPLVCFTKERSYTLAGIVSWGIDCGKAGVPGVNIKVQRYLDWISRNTGVEVREYWPK